MKTFKLYEDWKTILKKAWVVRFGILSGMLSVVEIVLPYFETVVPRGVFGVLSVITAFAIPYVRIVYQKDV